MMADKKREADRASDRNHDAIERRMKRQEPAPRDSKKELPMKPVIKALPAEDGTQC